MEPSDTVNVRIDARVAQLLATRAEALGLSRQKLIDFLLEREVLTGAVFGQPVAVAPGLLPFLAGDLDRAKGTRQQWILVYREYDTAPFTLVTGEVVEALPTLVYLRPLGDRTYPVPRALLYVWQPMPPPPQSYFDVLIPWLVSGATLHPSCPRQWHEARAELLRQAAQYGRG